MIATLSITVNTFARGSVVVDGIAIHFSVRGTGSKTVVFVHGWTCDETTWEMQVPTVSKKYRVITLDLPGHGKSGSPQDGQFSMKLFARAVDAVRAEVKADRIVLVGHSMGTRVVIEYARLFPEHVGALVLVDGRIRVGGNTGMPPDPERMGGPDGRKNRENMIRGMFSAATTPAVQSHIRSMMLAPPEATAVGAMKASSEPGNWKEDVMTFPVLGIYASRSRMAEPDYLKTRFPKLEFFQIPDTGHFLMLEKPGEFNHLLLNFLKNHRD